MSLDYLIQRFDGMDGSHHNVDAGPVDLVALRQASLGSWVAWKCSQSLAYVDPTFAAKRVELAQAGFTMRFFYGWISSTTDPVAQADFYVKSMGSFAPGEGAMIDAEEDGITVDGCLAWMERVEETTHRPTDVYTGLYVAGGTIFRDPRIRMSKYGPRPVHLAAYVSVANLTSRLIAQGVADLMIHAWQWSSNGPVPGITGRCDMNAINDVPTFLAACGLTPAPEPPAPTPTPVPAMEDHPMFTNSEVRTFDGTAYPAGVIKYRIMEDGSKRHIEPAEWAARGNPTGVPLTNAVIDAIPDWVAPSNGGAQHLTVNLTGTAAPA